MTGSPSRYQSGSRVTAPLRSKINPWLGRQLDKAGIVTGRRGAHILRHSLAVHLLRSGETLKSIGDRCWQDHTPYDPAAHNSLQTLLRQQQPTAT
jgi:integrase